MSDRRNNLYRKRFYTKKRATEQTRITNEIETSEKQLQSSSKDNASLYIHESSNIPYYGWTLYFDEQEYKNSSNTIKKVEAVKQFLKSYLKLSLFLTLENLEAGMIFHIDYNDLCDDEKFLNEWSNFKSDIQEKSIYTINCIKLAIHQNILNTMSKEDLESSVNSINLLPAVKVRILNYAETICLRDIKVNSYGKLINTKGCVVRVGRAKQLAQWFAFVCAKCGLEKMEKQSEGFYTMPKKCIICGVSTFQPVLNSPHVKTISFQMIRIQEIFNNEQETKGRMPRILDVKIFDDLVDTCMPGDDLLLTGIVKEVYEMPNVFSLLVHSLCPSIYGHEMIKAGLVLSLFGGNAKRKSLRDHIHVLIVGDPGLGKSQMLQACSRVAVKGVYICGNSSTSSGLTVTLTKENGTNDFALEPGALVLADRGCCCIDEFDKMSVQHQALLESMEQQSVTVAKSGILCSLPSRTSVLAAANHIGGRYDKSKTVLQNLNISQPLLSRFDLIFLLLDNPDKHRDHLICKHIMSSHINLNNKTEKTSSDDQSNQSIQLNDSLKEKLMFSSIEPKDIIPQIILKKYISYARQYVHPKLTVKAAEVLKKYYLELRLRNAELGGTPIYNRQLEAMIRLTEARAKLELRVEATELDALEVVKILEYTMMNILENPTLKIPLGNKLTGGKVKIFIKLLENEIKLNRQRLFSVTELNEIAVKGGVNVHDFTLFLSKLNEQGVLLQIERNVYKYVKI
ncbi:DNA helicase MCM8-like isoform X2 [Polistes fuscatus]|uniref:DNA helicase MCM8-like isoform X2 n=1 Tax=Polistes fuscatus TaxID=30207 RepID=UPI001CA98940|nr:DNA helicase MCM8-like isoform X2 [Polistes fuscatus]